MSGLKPGPVGKRDNERTGHDRTPHTPRVTPRNKQFGPDDFVDLPFDVELLVQPPDADDKWHPVAFDLYHAILRDPARVWMGPADWAILYLMCENLSRQLKPVYVGFAEGGIDQDTGEKIAGHAIMEKVPLKGPEVASLLRFLMAIGVTEAGRMGLNREITFNQAPKSEGVNEDSVVAGNRPSYPFSVPDAG